MIEIRDANSVKELEVLFFVALRIKVSIYEKNYWIRVRAQLGLEPESFGIKCIEDAKLQLSSVNYDYSSWKDMYGHLSDS